MNKFQIQALIFLSVAFPSLSYGDSLWNCRSDLAGTSAYERYIDVQYTFWKGEFKSVAIGYHPHREIAFANSAQLAVLADGSRQITYEGWPGAALDVHIYIMSPSIFDREANIGTLIEKGMTNFATTEVTYNCSRD